MKENLFSSKRALEENLLSFLFEKGSCRNSHLLFKISNLLESHQKGWIEPSHLSAFLAELSAAGRNDRHVGHSHRGDNKIWWGDLFKMGGKEKGIKAESELITHGKGVNLFQMAMSNCLSVHCQPLHPSEERLG
ncbi:hypothetical protein CDAR_281351 [Caerostris darwini]|uniref:Uncharacterized protein n=1 Tax=Caerostris darwini TaxID=1538125 RepID=A0AAV4WWH2_9ARAC|nr:hypothetical protein CDAR_281351 [Caerostris darwini]